MAEKTKSVQDGGIVFGNWKLFPVDSMNWELCHRHATTRGDNKGVVQWNRLGRFYQYNTIPNAIKYAADCELKDDCTDSAVELLSALLKYERIMDSLKTDVLAALGGAR